MAALNNKAHLVASEGDLESATELVQEAIDIARRSGYRHHQAALLNHLADLEHKVGHDGPRRSRPHRGRDDLRRHCRWRLGTRGLASPGVVTIPKPFCVR